MTEITPGIHWLKIPMMMPESTLAYVNNYLIQGDDGYLLVDTSWNTEEAFDALRKQVSEIGVDIRDISQIVITHIHPDHYGMAGRLRQLYGASIKFHNIEKECIEARYINIEILLKQTAHWLGINGAPTDQLTDMRDASIGMLKYVVPAYPDITLYGGETITTGLFNFRVIWTPGHSSGHICLYEPEQKVLISGDHILPTITPNISKHPQSLDNPLGKYLDSLTELKQLETELVLPAHNEPFNHLSQRIDELLQHHEQRNREILSTLKGESRNAYQIAREITWSISDSWQNIPLMQRRMAVFETLAHLDYMTVNGQVGKISKDSIIYYQQT